MYHQNHLKLEIESVLLGNPRVGFVVDCVYFDDLITQIILKVDWIGPQRKIWVGVSIIWVGVIKYIENLLKIEIESVLLGNPRVRLVAGRVYFDALITQIILKVDWIGPQRKKLV